ncbi:hypothetical protein ACH5RR_015541 [Cinchona calisaya]|uniref:Uncharacterized protein n=1 Tax=Cinchona calisaya TaxID=153742 RepID=A0ABD2ZX12_9GENT
MIDVHDGSLTIEFDGEIIRFYIYEAMRYPIDVHSVFAIVVIDSTVQKVFDSNNEDGIYGIYVVITKHLIMNDLKDFKGKLSFKEHVEEAVAILDSLPPLTKRTFYFMFCSNQY